MFRTSCLSVLLLAAACKHRPPPVVAPPSATVASAGPRSTSSAAEQAAIEQVKANFARIHFALDSSRLDSEAQSALAENARILEAFPGIRVEIQGHADERGTVDYNLALGMRRADGVSRALSAMGVDPARVRTISYGEERPLATASSEIAWSRNRRCEFRVTAGSGALGTTDG